MRKASLLMLLVVTFIGIVGCNVESDDDEVGTSTDGTGQDGTDGTDGTDSVDGDDTGFDTYRGEPCEASDPDPKNYDYGNSYPPGPYGFKGSLCWDADYNPTWTGGGDTLHDFCLPDQTGEEVCMHDFFRSEYDLLILAFDALWCPVCQLMASMEDKTIERLKAAGYNPIIIPVIENGIEQGSFPTQDDAMEWHQTFERTTPTLWDPEWTWADLALFDVWSVGRKTAGVPGFPIQIYINLETMRVWDMFEGWVDESSFDEFIDQEVEILSLCDGQPGS